MMHYLLILIVSSFLTIIFLSGINKELNVSIVPVNKDEFILSSFIFVLCFIFSFTISRFLIDAYAQSIAENKFVSGTIISFYLPSLSSKNNDFFFNIRTDNKNIDTISAIVNDTNINITQFKIDASVCVKINYPNNFFFKDFHYKNYIVDCNQTFNNDKHN